MSPGKQNVCLSGNIDRVIIKYYMEGAVSKLIQLCPICNRLYVHYYREKTNQQQSQLKEYFDILFFYFILNEKFGLKDFDLANHLSVCLSEWLAMFLGPPGCQTHSNGAKCYHT